MCTQLKQLMEHFYFSLSNKRKLEEDKEGNFLINNLRVN